MRIDTIDRTYYTVAMAMGKRRRRLQQTSMWVATQDLPRSVAHPFYARLNQILDDHDFDKYVEGLCHRFYADEGRPGLPPGRYFRLHFVKTGAVPPDVARALPRAFESRQSSDYADTADPTEDEVRVLRADIEAFIDVCAQLVERTTSHPES